MLMGGCVMLVILAGFDARVRAVDDRWGGPPVTVAVAARDASAGTVPELERVALPPAAIPPDAVTEVPAGAPLALALPRGAVVTRAHLDPRGPAAGLSGALRAVPVPVEASWGVTAGGWVDVWVLGVGDQPARQVATGRPVVELRDDTAATTALVGLEPREVAEVTAGLSVGRVLLAHAPAPRR